MWLSLKRGRSKGGEYFYYVFLDYVSAAARGLWDSMESEL